jgi:hypothetical protein
MDVNIITVGNISFALSCAVQFEKVPSILMHHKSKILVERRSQKLINGEEMQ